MSVDPDANAPPRTTTVGGSRGARYELLGRLAVGGMAELYLARTTGADGRSQVVVLKRILPHLAEDPEFVRMFRDEANLAATLQHPNIVRVYDIGRHGEDYFFTMEYVHGENLRAILRAAQKRGEQLPWQQVVSIALGVTSALHYAHEQVDAEGKPLQIVHRDVSPTNVLVSVGGAVKIVDFGIAKAAAGTHITQAGMLKGKASYMSPEQCRAEPVDRRSDVFAIGILLFEMTTLTRLFKGDNELAILHQVLTGNVPRPSTRRDDYPEQFESIVLRALRSKPDERYQTAQELQRDLEAFANAQGLSPSSQSLAEYLHSLFGPKPKPWSEPTPAPAEESASGLETSADKLQGVDETDLTRTRDNRTPEPRPAPPPGRPAQAGPRSPSTPARRRPPRGRPASAPIKPAVSARSDAGSPGKPAAVPRWKPPAPPPPPAPPGRTQSPTAQPSSAPRPSASGPSPIQQQEAAPKSAPATAARPGRARASKPVTFQPSGFAGSSGPARGSTTDAPTAKRTAPLGSRRAEAPSSKPAQATPGSARSPARYEPPVPSLDYPESGLLHTQVSPASSDVAAVAAALRIADEQAGRPSGAANRSVGGIGSAARPRLAFTPPTPEFDVDDDGGGQTQVAPASGGTMPPSSTPSSTASSRGTQAGTAPERTSPPSVEKTQVAQAIDKNAILAAAASLDGGAPARVDRTMVATQNEVRSATEEARARADASASTSTATASPSLQQTSPAQPSQPAPSQPLLRTQPMPVASASALYELDLGAPRRSRWPLIVAAVSVPIIAGIAALAFWPTTGQEDPDETETTVQEQAAGAAAEVTPSPSQDPPTAPPKDAADPDPADEDPAPSQKADGAAEEDDTTGAPGEEAQAEETGADAQAEDDESDESDADAPAEAVEPEPEPEPEPETKPKPKPKPSSERPKSPRPSRPSKPTKPKDDDTQPKPTPFPPFGPGSTIPP